MIGRLLRGLQYDGAAGGKGRPQLAGDQHGREIPGGEGGDHPDWNGLAHPDRSWRAARRRTTGNPHGLFAVPDQRFDGPRNLAARFSQRLSLLQSELPGERIETCLQSSAARRRTAPRCAGGAVRQAGSADFAAATAASSCAGETRDRLPMGCSLAGFSTGLLPASPVTHVAADERSGCWLFARHDSPRLLCMGEKGNDEVSLPASRIPAGPRASATGRQARRRASGYPSPAHWKAEVPYRGDKAARKSAPAALLPPTGPSA